VRRGLETLAPTGGLNGRATVLPAVDGVADPLDREDLFAGLLRDGLLAALAALHDGFLRLKVMETL